MTFTVAALILIALGALPSSAFVLYYGLAVPWWRSREGIHLFGFTATIALLLDLTLAIHLWGVFPGLRTVALILYASVAAFMWQRLYLLLSAQRRR